MSLRPVVAFDVDGTLSEYHLSIANNVWRYFGMQPRTGHWDGQGNYEDWLGITQAQYREAKLAYRQGGFKRWSPVMPGVNDLLVNLVVWRQTYDIEIWITTTRPWMRLDNVDPDTRFWLDRHFPMYDHLLYDEHKYSMLRDIAGQRVVAVLEDLPEQYSSAKVCFGEEVPFLLSRPHNAHAREIANFNHGGMIAAMEHVQTQLKKWSANHAR